MSYYAQTWGLTIHSPLEGGSVSVVIAAERNGEAVVLKIHPPWLGHSNDATSSAEIEAAAFRIWDGKGAPRLLINDTQALLLEYIPAAEHSPDMSARDVIGLVSTIARPVSAMSYKQSQLIPSIYEEVWRRYRRAAARRHEAVSDTLLMTATTYINYMLGSRALQSQNLIHGDFKNKNVLEKPDGSYVVIDPNPAIGSKLYDVALWAIDKPETMLERCAETAEYLKANPQIIGSLAVALSIPEICLASPRRAERTVEQVQQIAGTNSLEDYFTQDFFLDDFMGGSYIVADF